MSTITTEPITLKLSRFIKAPRERVFAAWITPSDVSRWLGGEKCHMRKATIDARAGGTYAYQMSDDASKLGPIGTFREVNPPSKLVFTWMAGACSGDANLVETLVTVEFTAQSGGTLVQLTHEGFASEESREGHNEGWTSSFDKLEKLS